MRKTDIPQKDKAFEYFCKGLNATEISNLITVEPKYKQLTEAQIQDMSRKELEIRYHALLVELSKSITPVFSHRTIQNYMSAENWKGKRQILQEAETEALRKKIIREYKKELIK